MEIIDRERRKRLTSIKDRMQEVRGSAAALLWEYGTLLGEVQRDELWRDDGCETFGDWAAEFADMTDESARKAIDVARHFTREMAERFGSEKLAATVRYLEATRQEEAPGDVQALQFRLRGERGAWTTVPFLKATSRQIREATAHVKETRRGKLAAAAAPEPHVRERALALMGELSAAPKGTVRGDRVRVTKGKDGRMAVSFQGIALDDLEAFVDSVRRHLIATS